MTTDPISREQRIADHLRKQLVRGYSRDSRFYRLVFTLTDEEILRDHDEHHAENVEVRKQVVADCLPDTDVFVSVLRALKKEREKW